MTLGRRGENAGITGDPSYGLWDISSDGLALTNARWDAELRLDDTELSDRGDASLRALTAGFRCGPLRAALVLQRLHIVQGVGHSSPPAHFTWWALDYNAVRFRDASDASSHRFPRPDAWSNFDRSFREAMKTFGLMRPVKSDADVLNGVFVRGGWLNQTWHPDFFRSSSPSFWFPHGPLRQQTLEQELRQRRVLQPTSWEFHDGPAPHLRRPGSDETLLLVSHDGSRLSFRLEGALGTFLLHVEINESRSAHAGASTWTVNCRDALQTRRGVARDRAHPRQLGEARLGERDWHAFHDALTEAFLSWPATEMSGLAPISVEFEGQYHEGAWHSSGTIATGLNAGITGLCG
jgi:hypothetical protein